MSHTMPFYRKIILALLCLWSLVVFFPGSYSVDSWKIFRDVTGGFYTDWHSPVTAFTWKVLYLVTEKFFVIYVVQILVYWLFFYLLLRVVSNVFVFFITLVLAVFFLFIPQYVMKDTHFALSLGIAFCLMADTRTRQNRWTPLLILFLLVYGLFIRLNSIVALLPVLYLFTENYVIKNGKLVNKLAATLCFCILVTAGYFIFTYRFLDAKREYPEYKLMLLDVTGITKSTGQNYLSDCFTSHPGYRHEEVLALYHPASFDHIYWPADGNTYVPVVNDTLNDCLRKSWLTAILSHPFVYFKNRFAGYLYYLKIKKRFADDEYWNTALWIDPDNPFNLNAEYNSFTNFLSQRWNALNDTAVYSSWFWLVLNLLFATLFTVWYRKSRRSPTLKLLAVVQFTGVLYILAQFPVFQHDRDFRYNYLNVLVFFIGFCYALDRSFRANHEEKGEDTVTNHS